MLSTSPKRAALEASQARKQADTEFSHTALKAGLIVFQVLVRICAIGSGRYVPSVFELLRTWSAVKTTSLSTMSVGMFYLRNS
jgi:hypothetical protein